MWRFFCRLASDTAPFRGGGFSCFMVLLVYGSVAQWIEQLRPKEKVVRSTRARATIHAKFAHLGIFSYHRSMYNSARQEENTHLNKL